MFRFCSENCWSISKRHFILHFIRPKYSQMWPCAQSWLLRGGWREASFSLICFWIKMHSMSKWLTFSLIFLDPSGTVWNDCLCLGYFLLCIVHAGKYIRLISLYKAGMYYTILFKDIQQFWLSKRVFMLWNFVLQFQYCEGFWATSLNFLWIQVFVDYLF